MKLFGKPVFILNLILIVVGIINLMQFLPALVLLTANILVIAPFIILPIASFVLALINLKRNDWSLTGFSFFDKFLIISALLFGALIVLGLYKSF